MSPSAESAREQLIRLSKNKKTRVIGIPPDRPSRWQPGGVLCPGTGFFFTTPGAWEFIAEVLETDVAIEEIPLQIPKGCIGYVLKVPGVPGYPPIYIKLEVGLGKVIGRSFHYSDREED